MKLGEQSETNRDTGDIMYGRTPLFSATENGHEEVVKILLERSDVNMEAANKHGITPL